MHVISLPAFCLFFTGSCYLLSSTVCLPLMRWAEKSGAPRAVGQAVCWFVGHWILSYRGWNPSRHQGKLEQNSQDGKMVEKATETEWDGGMSVGRWAGSYHNNHVRRILCIPRSQLGWGYEVELLLIVDSKILNPVVKRATDLIWPLGVGSLKLLPWTVTGFQ